LPEEFSVQAMEVNPGVVSTLERAMDYGMLYLQIHLLPKCGQSVGTVQFFIIPKSDKIIIMIHCRYKMELARIDIP
jgi:hypothetical protein